MAKLIFLIALLAQVVWFSHDFLEFTLWVPGCIICATGFLLDRRAFLSGNMLFWTVSMLLFVVAPASQYSQHYFLGEISVVGIRFSDTTVLMAVLACDLFLFSYLVTYFLLAPARSSISAPAFRDGRARVHRSGNCVPRGAADIAAAVGLAATTHIEPRCPGRSAGMDGKPAGAAEDDEPVVILDSPATDEPSGFGRSAEAQGFVVRAAEDVSRESFRVRTPERAVAMSLDASQEDEPVVILDLVTADEPSEYVAHVDGPMSAIQATAPSQYGVSRIPPGNLAAEFDEPFVILDLAAADEPSEYGAHEDGPRSANHAAAPSLYGVSRIPSGNLAAEFDEPFVIFDLVAGNEPNMFGEHADGIRSAIHAAETSLHGVSQIPPGNLTAEDEEPVVILDLAVSDEPSGPGAPSAAPKLAIQAANSPPRRISLMAPALRPFFVRPEFIGMLILADMLLLAFCWQLTGSFDFIFNGRSYAFRAMEDNGALGTFLNYFLQCTQIAFVSAGIERYRRMRSLGSLMSVTMVLSCALLFMNPLNTTRFVMASAGLTWLFFWWRGRISIKFFCLALAAFIIAAMPLLNVLRFGLTDTGFNNGDPVRLTLDYNQLDYDCFSMHVFAVQQTSLNGYTYGDNLVATLLFFVPREFWPGKPEPSNLKLGDNLVEHHSGWFNNLSCPPFSDAYMDFGLFGAIASGVIIACVMRVADRVIDSWQRRSFLQRGLALSFIAFIPILMRGSAASVIGALWLGMLMFLIMSFAFRNPAWARALLIPSFGRKSATPARTG